MSSTFRRPQPTRDDEFLGCVTPGNPDAIPPVPRAAWHRRRRAGNAAAGQRLRQQRLRRPQDVIGNPRGRREETICAVPVLYLILRFLEDLAGSGGSDPA